MRVQAVYDERLPLDNYEGVDITGRPGTESEEPIRSEWMYITVDGKPIDDRPQSSSDVQRCTDAYQTSPISSSARQSGSRAGGALAVAADPVAVVVTQPHRSYRSCISDVQQLWKFHQAC